MRQAGTIFRAVLFVGALAMVSGCTTEERHRYDMTSLQTQIGVLRSEISRLDQSLRETEAALQAAQEGKKATGVLSLPKSKPAYRTPSGFKLSAVDLQRALKNAGYYQGTIDGKIGLRTKKAIRNFQRDQGLVTDGICGRQTWARLKSFV